MFDIEARSLFLGMCLVIQSIFFYLFLHYTRKNNEAIIKLVYFHHEEVYRLLDESKKKSPWPGDHKWCGCNRCAQEKAFKFLEESRASSRHGRFKDGSKVQDKR